MLPTVLAVSIKKKLKATGYFGKKKINVLQLCGNMSTQEIKLHFMGSLRYMSACGVFKWRSLALMH